MTVGKPTIVLVDDSSDVRLLVKTRLRLSGLFDVVGEAEDGDGAVAQAEKHRPSLMLLDVSMPGKDGLTTLPEVRAASPETCVVIYSGFEEQGLVERALGLGAAAFVEKSLPVETLAERLAEICLGRRDTADAVPEPESAPETETAPDADQATLDQHLERFREVFDEAAIGMATMTLAGTLVRANRALASVLGRGVDELVGMPYRDLTDGGADEVAEALRDIRVRPLDVVKIEHGVSVPRDRRRVLATLAPVRDQQGRPLYIFLQVQDVTAEREAMEALRQSEQRFRLLVETVEDYAIFMLSPEGVIASWNAGAQRSLGYAADEIIGRHFSAFYPAEVAASGHCERELEIALRDGHYEEEGWRVRKDGATFWSNVVITAVFDDEGRHVGFAKVTRDMSERRRLEQEREQAVEALAEANGELNSLNDRLRQAAEDQAQFLAVTAHELRSPVAVLGGSADMLAKHWTQLDEEEREDLLGAMASSTTRLRRLLEDLLTASRLQSSRLEMRSEAVLVGDVVADSVNAVRRAHPKAEVVVDVTARSTVLGDRDRLAQAVENLVGNAIKHGRPPVRVEVAGGPHTVEIRVSDGGSGVSPDVQARLFQRFATGLVKGGTGLGLFIVRELARAHGGDADYLPAEGDGSGVFVISLPRADASRGA